MNKGIFLKNKSILITGGTGSFGQFFVKEILKHHSKIKKIVVFSRDELKQFEMSEKFSLEKYPKLRYFLGDLRDKERVSRALVDIDIVVHAAALKQVPKAEGWK
jgi:FlaA1/EpsC-like NDP-sugar epimerase